MGRMRSGQRADEPRRSGGVEPLCYIGTVVLRFIPQTRNHSQNEREEERRMTRQRMLWIVAAILLIFLYGCPKKKPATKPSDLNVETTTVATPSNTPPTDVKPPAGPATQPADQTEDPLMSQDLAVVNDELRRRGFSPDVYFEYDQSSLSDETRAKLSRNADLLQSHARLSITIEG